MFSSLWASWASRTVILLKPFQKGALYFHQLVKISFGRFKICSSWSSAVFHCMNLIHNDTLPYSLLKHRHWKKRWTNEERENSKKREIGGKKRGTCCKSIFPNWITVTSTEPKNTMNLIQTYRDRTTCLCMTPSSLCSKRCFVSLKFILLLSPSQSYGNVL